MYANAQINLFFNSPSKYSKCYRAGHLKFIHKAWFPYRCICRVCRTKKIHRTDAGNLPYKCSIQKKRQIQLVVQDRMNSICPMNFFRTTDTTETTDTTIWKPGLSVSELFREEIFKLVRLQVIGAKICGIFHTTVTSKFLMNFLTNFLPT